MRAFAVRRVRAKTMVSEHSAARVFINQSCNQCRFTNPGFANDQECVLEARPTPLIDFLEKPLSAGEILKLGFKKRAKIQRARHPPGTSFVRFVAQILHRCRTAAEPVLMKGLRPPVFASPPNSSEVGRLTFVQSRARFAQKSMDLKRTPWTCPDSWPARI
jgi:hypothetical protein